MSVFKKMSLQNILLMEKYNHLLRMDFPQDLMDGRNKPVKLMGSVK